MYFSRVLQMLSISCVLSARRFFLVVMSVLLPFLVLLPCVRATFVTYRCIQSDDGLGADWKSLSGVLISPVSSDWRRSDGRGTRGGGLHKKEGDQSERGNKLGRWKKTSEKKNSRTFGPIQETIGRIERKERKEDHAPICRSR